MKAPKFRLPRRTYGFLKREFGHQKNWKRILGNAMLLWKYWAFWGGIPKHSVLAQFLNCSRRTILRITALLKSVGFLTIRGHGYTSKTVLSPSSLHSSPDSAPSGPSRDLRELESLREARRTGRGACGIESSTPDREPEPGSEAYRAAKALGIRYSEGYRVCENCRDGFDQALERCCTCPRGRNRAENLALNRETDSILIRRKREEEVTWRDMAKVLENINTVASDRKLPTREEHLAWARDFARRRYIRLGADRPW